MSNISFSFQTNQVLSQRVDNLLSISHILVEIQWQSNVFEEQSRRLKPRVCLPNDPMATDVCTCGQNAVPLSTSSPVHCGRAEQPMPVLLRGSIARSIYERMQREDQLRQFDKTRWYQVDRDALSTQLNQTFVQMDCDRETQQFLDVCYEKSDQYFTHLFQSIARTILCLFMSSTSVNGLLGRGSMFVFSDAQFRSLLGQYLDVGINLDKNSDNYSLNGHSDKVLIDLGAGDGKVTEVMAKYFGKTYTTEISPVMRKILIKKGFEVLEIDRWAEKGRSYDLVSCLNVLDRCDKPLTMLDDIKQSLRPNGIILLALVLPFSQYVEVNDGKRSDHRPSEVLAIEGQTFEKQLVSFTENVLRPKGLQVVSWAKLPYLCEGDIDLTYYWLYDVVLVLKPTDH